MASRVQSALIVLLLLPFVHSDSYDVVIYGATPAGVGAALSLADLDPARRIALIEPTKYIGGMASPGGIGLRDHHDASVLNSTELEWAMINAVHYNVTYPVWQPDSWLGQKSFQKIIASRKNVHLVLEQVLEDGSVTKSGTTITSMQTSSTSGGLTTWTAPFFIDGTYEGDLIAAGGASLTFGREAKSVYNESYGGITSSSIAQFDVDVDPVWTNGTLLPFLQNRPDPRLHLGEADDNVMAYSFRACLSTDPNNQVPFSPPEGYKTEDFEIARRFVQGEIAAGKKLRMPWGNLPYSSYPAGTKRDACCGSGPVGIDAVGLELGYVNGSRAERERVYNLIRYYVQGLMWFWSNDPESGVPADVQKSFRELGLCKDEWPENGHLPPQLYVREAYRLVGDRVFTQNDRTQASATNCRNDSIGVAIWGIDIHEMQRLAVHKTAGDPTSKLIAYNEGLTSPGTGGFLYYELPYWLLLPKRSELTNIMAPNCPSISHVAFASLRVEPTLWRLGQSVGTAMHVALTTNTSALQDVDISRIQDLLTQQGVTIHYPFRPKCDSPVPPPPPPPPPPSPPNCTRYEVKGAGSAVCNGNYTYTGKYSDGVGMFANTVSHQIGMYRYEGQWHIGINGKEIDYASTELHTPLPPSSHWIVGVGSTPAPQVSCAN